MFGPCLAYDKTIHRVGLGDREGCGAVHWEERHNYLDDFKKVRIDKQRRMAQDKGYDNSKQASTRSNKSRSCPLFPAAFPSPCNLLWSRLTKRYLVHGFICGNYNEIWVPLGVSVEVRTLEFDPVGSGSLS